MSDQSELIFVADIGGTNARFALARQTSTLSFDISCVKVFKCSEFDSFASAFKAYKTFACDELKDAKDVDKACIAIAAIIKGDSVQMTSLPWGFSRRALMEDIGLTDLKVINDFVSLAMSVPFMQPENLTSIKAGVAKPRMPKTVLGPGTGLGTALLVPTGKKWIPIAAQGGHVNFSPNSKIEKQLLDVYHAKKSHVSYENFLCGSGLSRIYDGLTEIETGTIVESPTNPALITDGAISRSDPKAIQALDIFFSMLGCFAGNAALICGSEGGVYLAGGILPRIKELLIDSKFNKLFGAKGVSADFVEDIPIYLVDHPQPALLGSAAYFFESA